MRTQRLFTHEGDAILAGLVMWAVILLLIVVAIFWAATAAHAIPISYSFTGVLADGGTITGAFAYDNETAAIATNVRNLSPNSVFSLSSAFTMAPMHFQCDSRHHLHHQQCHVFLAVGLGWQLWRFPAQ
jgi:hypothetical protein